MPRFRLSYLGDKTNSSVFYSLISQRIVLTKPGTKQVVLEFYENRLPSLCQLCCQQNVRCVATISGETQTIGSIRQGYVGIESTFIRNWKNDCLS